MNEPIAGLIICFEYSGGSRHAHHRDRRGQLGDRDSLPGPGDQRHRARGKVDAMDDATGHMAEQDGLERHWVGQQLLELLMGEQVEGFVGGCEDGEGSGLGEEGHEVGGLDEGDESGELGVEDQQIQDGAHQVAGAYWYVSLKSWENGWDRKSRAESRMEQGEPVVPMVKRMVYPRMQAMVEAVAGVEGMVQGMSCMERAVQSMVNVMRVMGGGGSSGDSVGGGGQEGVV